MIDSKDTDYDPRERCQAATTEGSAQLAVAQPTLDIDGLAAILHRSRTTVLTDRCRNPHRLPPAYHPPGARDPLWIRAEVMDWLRSHPEQHAYRDRAVRPAPRRPGRPAKAETVYRSRGDA